MPVRGLVSDKLCIWLASTTGRKEGNILFNDALNTFYIWLYGIGHMVNHNDHSDSERGNLLPPHGLLFPINSKGSFICTIPETGYAYHSLCYTSRIAQWVHPVKDRSDDPLHHNRTLLPRSYISLPASTTDS